MIFFDRFAKNKATPTPTNGIPRTALNPQTQNEKGTVVNPQTGNNPGTVLNPQTAGAQTDLEIGVGTLLCGEYAVKSMLDVESGEADLYICEKGNREYIAKVYRRQQAIKQEVVEKISRLHNQYVAPIHAIGDFAGFPVEILPYYPLGSLAGRKFTFEQLKREIIPALNSGLHAMHAINIIHKDLKPSNIMRTNEKGGIAIIDFGISSVLEEGNTIIMTKLGMTPDYSAQEAFCGLFLAESDYYSMGITIYELFAGHTPFYNLTQDEIERMLAVSTLPMPENMPQELQNLIIGLTYRDISNRHDKSNPNRRWTYEEVDAWCRGVSQVIPGSTGGYGARSIRPYEFLDKEYDTAEKLVDALNAHWEEGKREFLRGLISGHYKSVDKKIANALMDLEDELEEKKGNKDIYFMRALHVLAPDRENLYWKGKQFDSLQALGQYYLSSLYNNDPYANLLMDELLREHVLSAHLACVAQDNTAAREAVKAAEARQVLDMSEREKQIGRYEIAYMLSGNRTLKVDGVSFNSPDDIVAHMEKLLDKSEEALDAFSKKLLPRDDVLDIRFESWLRMLGKQQAIADWRKNLMA